MCCAVAQHKQGCVIHATFKGSGRSVEIGTAQLKVMYALNAMDINDESTYIDLHVLLAGKNVSKQYSRFLELNDSLFDEFERQHPNARSRPRIFYTVGRNSDYWSEYQYTDIYAEKDQYTCYAYMPWGMTRYNAYYTEPMYQQQWSLQSERQIILGYDCQKATCKWRGRTFEAWFSTDIPVRLGPWIFGGLPGLILKINDVDNLYTWEAVSLSTGNFPVKKRVYEGFIKDTRDNVHKLQVAINRNYLKTAGACNPSTGQMQSSPHPYEPLEKE